MTTIVIMGGGTNRVHRVAAEDAEERAAELAREEAEEYGVDPVWCPAGSWHHEEGYGAPLGGYDVTGGDMDYGSAVIIFEGAE